ncbi:MAG: D-TA family PLP-dependent enzyme [Pirellulaceae bacterium]|nr:D-TA family PLP-dependent enzyme [Pirellulaceae bacterium]
MQLAHFDNLKVDQLLTPCLVVSPQIIQQNLRAMIHIADDVQRLRPHVKTHKCPEIVKTAVAMGITRHKCATLAEAEMLAQLADDILLAYQPVGPVVGKFVELVHHFPQRRFSTVLDAIEPASQLSDALTKRRLNIDVLIEVDPGMHRTGVGLGPAVLDLAAEVQKLPGLRLSGLHIYDGHHHQVDLEQRSVAVEEMMRSVLQLVAEARGRQLPIDRLVCGGTPTFPILAQWAQSPLASQASCAIELSPGTSVLSDYNYDRDYPDVRGVSPAAILLTRVISKPDSDLVTVDLGYKSISADPPAGRRCYFADLPDAQEVRHSEEHLVIRTTQADALQVGQVLRVIPAHICPTVALHDWMFVCQQGDITGKWPIVRHRIYQ